MDNRQEVISKIDEVIRLSKKKVELLEELKESTLFAFSKYNIREIGKSNSWALLDSKTGEKILNRYKLHKIFQYLQRVCNVDINSMDVYTFKK